MVGILIKRVAAILLVVCTSELRAAEWIETATMEAVLKDVVVGHYDEIADNRLDQALRFYHSRSPEVIRQRAEITLGLESYLQKTVTLKFTFTGRRGDFASGTGQHRFLRIAGTKFFEEFAEVSYVFRKQSGAWKLWSSSAL